MCNCSLHLKLFYNFKMKFYKETAIFVDLGVEMALELRVEHVTFRLVCRIISCRALPLRREYGSF